MARPLIGNTFCMLRGDAMLDKAVGRRKGDITFFRDRLPPFAAIEDTVESPVATERAVRGIAEKDNS